MTREIEENLQGRARSVYTGIGAKVMKGDHPVINGSYSQYVINSGEVDPLDTQAILVRTLEQGSKIVVHNETSDLIYEYRPDICPDDPNLHQVQITFGDPNYPSTVPCLLVEEIPSNQEINE